VSVQNKRAAKHRCRIFAWPNPEWILTLYTNIVNRICEKKQKILCFFLV
jgi:hypothetical protein